MHEFDKCIILADDGQLLAEGFVHDYEAGVMNIYVAAGVPENALPYMNVTVFVYNSSKGECKYTAAIRKVNYYYIEINHISLISSVQKRSATRVSKQLVYRITDCIRDGAACALDEPARIVILNISAQGMYFKCEDEYAVGFTFPLTFRETSRPVNLTVKVVRRNDFSGSFNYGCAFVGINERDMNEICRYVIKEQIRQIRRKTF